MKTASPKNVVIVCQGYPSKLQPDNAPFVRQFAFALARQGHTCSVICPTRWLEFRHGRLPAREETELAPTASVRVLRPRYLSFSVRQVGGFNTGQLTYRFFNRAALRAIDSHLRDPEVIYGHFLYPSGHAAVVAATQLHCVGLVGVGEGAFWTVKPVGFQRARRDFAAASGVIAVSSVIRRELLEKLGLPAEKVPVFPNGVDLEVFYPRDRAEMCRKHGIPENTFNIVFVGDFRSDKGVGRLLAAARDLPNVSLILVGRGTLPDASPQVVFEGPVAHRLVPELLGAGDLFVLPTLIEGCCNAVIEAMACGLPIVSSDGDYMNDLLTEEVALRVNPLDVGALRQAIRTLMMDPPRRRQMACASAKRGRSFDITARARHIMEWVNGGGPGDRDDRSPVSLHGDSSALRDTER